MNLMKKRIAIGIIAIFIGLAFTPMSRADIIDKEVTDIPVEISMCQNDGTISLETVKLTKDDIKVLDNLLQDIYNTRNEAEIEEKKPLKKEALTSEEEKTLLALVPSVENFQSFLKLLKLEKLNKKKWLTDLCLRKHMYLRL